MRFAWFRRNSREAQEGQHAAEEDRNHDQHVIDEQEKTSIVT
jgi:hypothetical protein